MNRTALLTLAALAAAALSTGCSTRSYRTADAWTPTAPDDRAVDEAVSEALAAAPQMVTDPRVAVYSLDPDRADAVVEALEDVEGIAGVYALPTFLVDGRMDGMSGEPDVAQLRLLAAQARCDLLVLADHRWEQETGVNGLVAFNVLLVPALFTPFLKVEVDSSLDSYVYDVRNGYFYGVVSARQSGADRFNTLYAVEEPALVERHWAPLVEDTRASMAALLAVGG